MTSLQNHEARISDLEKPDESLLDLIDRVGEMEKRLCAQESAHAALVKIYTDILKRQHALEAPAAPQVAGGVEPLPESAAMADIIAGIRSDIRTARRVGVDNCAVYNTDVEILCDAAEQLTAARAALSTQGQRLGDVIRERDAAREAERVAKEKLAEVIVGLPREEAPTPAAPCGSSAPSELDTVREEVVDLCCFVNVDAGDEQDLGCLFEKLRDGIRQLLRRAKVHTVATKTQEPTAAKALLSDWSTFWTEAREQISGATFDAGESLDARTNDVLEPTR